VSYRDLYQRWSAYFGVLGEGREMEGGEAASQSFKWIYKYDNIMYGIKSSII